MGGNGNIRYFGTVDDRHMMVTWYGFVSSFGLSVWVNQGTLLPLRPSKFHGTLSSQSGDGLELVPLFGRDGGRNPEFHGNLDFRTNWGV